MKDLLGRLNITGFDASSYISDHAKNISALPNIAIALSGGGYRALLNGAGALKAFDNREENGTAPGHLGGLLQSSTYVAGLSGGSWLTGSIFVRAPYPSRYVLGDADSISSSTILRLSLSFNTRLLLGRYGSLKIPSSKVRPRAAYSS